MRTFNGCSSLLSLFHVLPPFPLSLVWCVWERERQRQRQRQRNSQIMSYISKQCLVNTSHKRKQGKEQRFVSHYPPASVSQNPSHLVLMSVGRDRQYLADADIVTLTSGSETLVDVTSLWSDNGQRSPSLVVLALNNDELMTRDTFRMGAKGLDQRSTSRKKCPAGRTLSNFLPFLSLRCDYYSSLVPESGAWPMFLEVSWTVLCSSWHEEMRTLMSR